MPWPRPFLSESVLIVHFISLLPRIVFAQERHNWKLEQGWPHSSADITGGEPSPSEYTCTSSSRTARDECFSKNHASLPSNRPIDLPTCHKSNSGLRNAWHICGRSVRGCQVSGKTFGPFPSVFSEPPVDVGVRSCLHEAALYRRRRTRVQSNNADAHPDDSSGREVVPIPYWQCCKGL